MGTISPPFILCPLSDRKQLLGMSEDKSPNKVIITVGRNIAIRYYILEQKQERSWTISQHWLTSRVVYCPEFEKYGAVVDNNMIGLWDEEDTTVNRFRIKLKFDQPVLELRPTKTLGTLVVFGNGFVCGISKLKSMQENGSLRKREFKGVIDTNEESIVDITVNEADGEVILIISQNPSTNSSCTNTTAYNQKQLKILVAKLQLGVYEEEVAGNEEPTCDKISDTYIVAKKKKAGKILGQCVIPRDGNSVVYIDSNGKILEKKCGDSDSNPVDQVGSIGDYVSLKSPVVIRLADEGSTLVMYGSDPSEEGAVVFLYDLKYNVLLAKQSLKLYGTPPIMEKVGTNIIVPVGLHILVLGISISKSLLSAVVAKHRLKAGEEVFEQRNPWSAAPVGFEKLEQPEESSDKGKLKQKDKDEPEHDLPSIKKEYPTFWEYVHQFNTLDTEGQPEAAICNQIIPAILGNDNIPALDWILDAVTDIPENLLVSILSFLLKIRQDPFLTRMGTSDSKENQSNEENHLDGTSFTPDTRINSLLFRDVDERELVRALPTMDYGQVKYLISYLKSMMDYDWPVTQVEGETRCENEVDLQLSASRWIKWISCVLNAHYAKFVINSEIDMVESLLVAIDERTKLFDAIEEFSPYFLMTYNKVNFEPRPNPNSKWRSEIITFV